MMIIGAMIVLPALNYTMTVTKTGRSVQNKVERRGREGRLRTVLADGKGLYQACKDAGISDQDARLTRSRRGRQHHMHEDRRHARRGSRQPLVRRRQHMGRLGACLGG